RGLSRKPRGLPSLRRRAHRAPRTAARRALPRVGGWPGAGAARARAAFVPLSTRARPEAHERALTTARGADRVGDRAARSGRALAPTPWRGGRTDRGDERCLPVVGSSRGGG